MGFTQAVKGLRDQVFDTLGDPALLNDTTAIRARLRQREEALGFGQGNAIATRTTIEVPVRFAVKRGDRITFDAEARAFEVIDDPVLVRSGVLACPAREVAP